MPVPESIENIIGSLPDADAALRFYEDLVGSYSGANKLSEPLVSDLLTLASFSPLLSTTILQNPDYIHWLARERTDTQVRSKELLLESLSRFSLLHTDIQPNVMLARFRRRELLRIFLRDIRRLATVTEITEELANLADAIIDFALRLARQDLDNRYGTPLHADDRGRSMPASFCVVALGKLGSRELNYSSDIDLLFIYSHEGTTSDTGVEASITNREYFIKLAERIIQIAGSQAGEGAAYRVDMRLRPHGSIGRLALSLEETIRYYSNEAREWEQQALIRSRGIAGELEIYKEFHKNVEDRVFRERSKAASLESVRRAKRRLEDPTRPGPGYNVKLGRGGIREIEFIAQAMQLAYGGRDKWLRAPHTLVSLSRIADRGLISDKQLTALYDAYEFLRHTEHLLQMEHGLQTHTIPKGDHELLARRAGFENARDFDDALQKNVINVQRVFASVFSETTEQRAAVETDDRNAVTPGRSQSSVQTIAEVSPFYSEIFSRIPSPIFRQDLCYRELLIDAVSSAGDLSGKLSVLRQTWVRCLYGIVFDEVSNVIAIAESKRLQTELAEAAIGASLAVTRSEIQQRFGINDLRLDVLALGKLGGRGVDYGSDLDLVLVYPDHLETGDLSASELYNRAVEIFVTTLSGITRDGNLYRVDLRLRPYGKNGASATRRTAIVDYFRKSADLWELLAFVKLRGVTGEEAVGVEHEVREIIHQRAQEIGRESLRAETLRIRQLLEREKGGRDRESDIKYGPGGMLDVYFAARYLQLRDNVPDRDDERSTLAILEILFENRSLGESDHESLATGYSFISELDHSIRLTTGRSRRIPTTPDLQEIIASRMKVTDRGELARSLALHRLNVRRAFEFILS